MKFEDLEVWKHLLQLSMDLSQTFFNLKDYGFKNQITLTGLSVTSNNVGRWEYESLKKSLQFLSHTKIRVENYEHKYTLK